MKIRRRKMREVESSASKALMAMPKIKKGSWAFAGPMKSVGGSYAELWDAKMNGRLIEGAVLRLKREPENLHDKLAIAVYTYDGKVRIGYVPRENHLLAAIMDIGIVVGGRVVNHHTENAGGVHFRLYIGRPK